MTIDSQIFAVIALVSGAIGGALLIKVKVAELAKSFAEHIESDNKVQTSLVDRLARIETKIDLLLPDREHH